MAEKEQNLCNSERDEIFTKSGICSDEITFIFDDDNKLYVSQNFLRYVSPVFRAMFKHDFGETKSRTVKLPGKDYADFLEFLLCLHPETLKPVDNTNVLRICVLADEYHQSALVKKCKEVMLNLLSEQAQHYNSLPPKRASATRACLQILIKAESLRYEEVVARAVSTIISFGYKYFAGKPRSSHPKHGYIICTVGTSSKDVKDILLDCKALYDSLGETIKLRMLSERLDRLDESDFHD